MEFSGKPQRILYLDILRVASCSAVVLMHTPHPQAGVPGYVQAPIYYLTSAGLVMFFMVSGALLLSTRLNMLQFLKRRIGKIAGPWLFWTIFYMAVNAPFGGFSLEVVKQLFIFVSSPGKHVMWFMFVLLGLYLITPILSRFVQNATCNDIKFYLLLWSLSLFLPWFYPYCKLSLGISSPLYYLSGYVGYFLLGYYLHTYRPKVSSYAVLLIIVPLIAKLIYVLYDGQRSDVLFGYLSIPVMLMSIAWFTLAQKWSDKVVTINPQGRDIKVRKFLKLLSDCSFGIYLIHFFIMRHCIWRIRFIVYGCGWLGQVFLTWLLTMIISFIITYALSFIPFSEFIIGIKHQNDSESN